MQIEWFKQKEKQWKCDHDWKLIDEQLIEMGMNKMFTYRCPKCIKRKRVTLDNRRWWKKHNKDGSVVS